MRRLLCWAVLLPVAGCGSVVDIYERPGTWRPVGANDANLRAMIADPDDLVTGVADRQADGQVVAAAVARYRTGTVKDLPDTAISKVARIGSAPSGGSSASTSTQ